MVKDSNNLVIKEYLDKKLSNFVTKSYLDKKLGVLRSEMTKMKDEIVGMKDEIVNELKSMREEFAVHQFQHQTTNDTLDNHKGRLHKLEKPML